MTKTTTPGVDNGVDVAALLGARDALTVAPEAARFQWRARTKWVNGTHSRTTVHDFAGLGAEHTHRQPFLFGNVAAHDDVRHPPRFGCRERVQVTQGSAANRVAPHMAEACSPTESIWPHAGWAWAHATTRRSGVNSVPNPMSNHPKARRCSPRATRLDSRAPAKRKKA
jgi:hypothetical protein